MKLLFIAVASSVLLAAISTGITFRFLADAPVIAFIVTLVLMFIVAVVNARTALRTVTAAAPAAAASGGQKPRGKRDNNRAPRNQDKPRERKPRQDDEPAGKPGAPIQHEGKPVTGDYESGNVKWFSRSKGFGFIVRPNGEEIFVHYRSVRSGEDGRRPNLRDGQDVKYIVTDHDKGLQAEDVSAA